MRRRILWLLFWMTLAFWAGCTARYGPSAEENQPVDPVEPVDAPLVREVQTLTAPGAGLGVDYATPSVTGIERKNWPRITVTHPHGETKHNPTYFEYDSVRITRDRPSPLMPAHITTDVWGMDARVSHALRGPDFELQLSDIGDMGLAPVKAGFDTVAAPVNMVVQPPWEEIHSPSR